MTRKKTGAGRPKFDVDLAREILQQDGQTWSSVARHFNVSWETLRRQLDPEWAEKRRQAINANRRAEGSNPSGHAARRRRNIEPPEKVIHRIVDTRSPTSKLLGDPPPGRSALDQKRAEERALKNQNSKPQ